MSETISGTLTGSGGGTVQLDSNIEPGIGGLTLNFPGSMLQWTGGTFWASVGDVTNLGTLNLAGASDKGIFEDGTLDNFGTIIQTGTGNLALHSDSVTATTLKIETGASYLIESNAGIDNTDGGTTAVINAGTIRKTAGSGTSQLYINGAITNTGTIEADSGTLFIDANSAAQLSGSTLTGGTWNALGGANLQFPSGTRIATNAANISLGGADATITGIAGLTSNSGGFSLTGGANFTTTGTFSNSGTLTVGTGGTLSVAGNFTQTAAGTLDEQIGGTPASGLFGKAAVSQTAALAGGLNLALVNSFKPSAGSAFAVLSFAQSTGDFTTVSGLSPYFTESLGAGSLDLVNGSGGAVDLAATSVTAPSAATAGQEITVAWQADNQSSQAAAGSWQDSVYFSTTSAITASSTLLGSVEHSGGLSASGSYRASLAAAVPALAPGNYYVIVEVDGLYQVSEHKSGQQHARRQQPTQRQRARAHARHACQRRLHRRR